MKTRNRLLAAMLTLVMIISMLPISAFAENDPPATGTDIVVEELTNSTEEPTKETASPAAPGELPGTGEGKEQGDNSGGEDKTAESTPTPEPSKAPAKQAAPAQGADDETPPAAIYTVTFDANGHGEAPEAVTVMEGETLQKPADPTEDGYTFTGWYEDKDATDAWDFSNNTVTGHTTLYAGWTENTQRALRNAPALRNGNTDPHSVTVTHNGYGSAEASPDSAIEGTTITLTATPQSGYSLDYWEVLSGGVTVTNNTFEMGTEDVEVKAIFKYDPTNHFIKIDPSLQNLKFGKPVTLRLSEGGLSNGAITWTSSDPSTLSINGTEATFHKTGTVRITASQAAYGEFAAVTDSLEVTIGKGDASSIDWPTPGPVYTKIVYRDVALNGGSTEFGSFAWKNPYGTENGNPGSSSGSRVVFSPKAELASYFEADISQWLTFTVQARDTLDSCISVSPNTIDFGTVEQRNLDVLTEIFISVNNLTNLSVAAFVDITPGDNDYFRVRNASGGSMASPGDGIRFGIKPKTTLTPGTYEVPITFTAATSNESVEKTLTAKIVVKDNLPEASVTISPDMTKFDLTERYDPDKVAQTITLTNTGQKPLEITDYAFKGGIYTFDLELISTSSTIPAGGTAQYRIKPKPGQTYPGYALISYHSLRFTLKDSDGQQSAKETAVTMKVSEYVDYFGALTVSPNTVDFGTETVGYQMLPEQTVVFSNHNIVNIKGNRFPRSSNYILRFWQEDLRMIDSDVVIAPGIRARMTVAPRQGLPAGTYDETLEIEFYNYWGEMETRTVNLKFTVEKAESTVTVTGDGNGTASASVSPAKEGTIVYLSAIPNNGYQFSHWEVTSGGVTLDDAYSQMTAFKIGKDDVSVKAHFKEIPSGEYSVQVTTDGHGSASASPTSGANGKEVRLTAKPVEGYYFDRWEVLSGGVRIDNENKFMIGDADVQIKAVFAKNPYQVSVSVEGLGTAEATPDSGRAGDTVSLTATPREYYRFKEWRIASGSGTIADKTSATTTFTFANESAEVKAVFEAIPYGVDIDYVGKGTVEELPGTYNDEFMLTAIPADGYKFYKWEVLDHSTGVITAVGTNKAFIAVKCHAERIKLQVTFVTIPYSISYTLNGGTNASGNPDTYTVEDTIVLAEPGRDGFTFDGWYDESGKKMTTIPAGTTGDLTLEARWKPTVYSITYNLNGGSNHPDNPATYTVETNTITLKDASHGVLVFDGWYDASGNKVTQIVKGSKGNLTLEARWKKASAPTIIFPTASDISYGQTLADSVLTGGSTEYGMFAWEEPSRVPGAGTIPCGVIFTPSAETEQNYEPIPDANRKQNVSVTVMKATPAVTISVKKDTAGTTATLTATVQKAGQGLAPTGTVKFEYSTDNGTTWTTVPSGDAVTLAAGTDGNASATRPWDSFDENTTYILRATYGGDSNYNQRDGNTIFDPRKEDQSVLQVELSKTDPVYGDVLTFRTSGGSGDGAVAYTVSDPSVMTVDANGKVSILKSGTVVVTATKEGDTNYNAATASISVTVKKAELTFTAEDKTVNQGGTMPAFTFKTTGLVSGDTVSTDPVLTTTAADTNTAGTFDIQISGGAVTTNSGAAWTDCYEPVYEKGLLTVNTYYTVSVINDGNGSGTANPTSGTQGAQVTLTASPHTGYKFKEWQLVTANGGTIDNATANPAQFTIGTGDAEIKAIFEQITYSVTVSNDGNGSGSANPSSGAPGSKAALTATPSGGYKFKEWQLVTANGGTIDNATANPAQFTIGTGDAEIKAIFEQIEYTVRFMDGSSELSTQPVKHGATATRPADPTKGGYEFGGWYADSGLQSAFDFTQQITAETMVYAKFTAISYSVTVGANSSWTKDSAETLTVTVKRSPTDASCFSHFDGVEIDGTPLVNGTDYTAVAGSTVVTLKAATLQKLSTGSHSVTVLFDDGKVNTGLTVKAAGSSGTGTSSSKGPKTGDESNLALWLTMMIASLIAMVLVLLGIRKKKVQNGR